MGSGEGKEVPRVGGNGGTYHVDGTLAKGNKITVIARQDLADELDALQARLLLAIP